MSAKKTYSLDDLNIKEKSATGFTFPFLDQDGDETGITFTVIGSHSEKVQKFYNEHVNKMRSKEYLAKKRGKEVEPESFEMDIDFTAEHVAMRIVAWTGIEQPCTLENAIKLCTVNPLAFEQVSKASDEVGNFTGKK